MNPEINQFETRRDDHRLYLCHLPEGTSDLLIGPKMVFRGLCFTPKLPLNPILTLRMEMPNFESKR